MCQDCMLNCALLYDGCRTRPLAPLAVAALALKWSSAYRWGLYVSDRCTTRRKCSQVGPSSPPPADCTKTALTCDVYGMQNWDVTCLYHARHDKPNMNQYAKLI